MWAVVLGTGMTAPALAQTTGAGSGALRTDTSAQGDMKNGSAKSDMHSDMSLQHRGALVLGSNLLGKPVEARDGTRIGTVKDIVVDTSSRDATLLIVRLNDNFNAGAQSTTTTTTTTTTPGASASKTDSATARTASKPYVALPWSQIDLAGNTAVSARTDAKSTTSVDKNDKATVRSETGAYTDAQYRAKIDSIRLKASQAEIVRGQMFDDASWSSVTDRTWIQRVYQGYGADYDSRLQSQISGSSTLRTGAQHMDNVAKQNMGVTADSSVAANSGQLIRLSTLDDVVVNRTDGKELGHLEDLVIDSGSGQVAYATFAQPKWLGLAETDAAIPFGAVSFSAAADDRNKTVARINATDEQIKGLAIKTDHDFSDAAWAQRIHGDLNQEPYWNVAAYVSPSGRQQSSMSTQSSQSFRGEIQSVDRVRVNGAADQQTKVTIKGDDGQTRTIYFGTDADLRAQNLTLRKGMKIDVSGQNAQFGTDQALRASQVTIDGRQYNLRSATDTSLKTDSSLKIQTQQNGATSTDKNNQNQNKSNNSGSTGTDSQR